MSCILQHKHWTTWWQCYNRTVHKISGKTSKNDTACQITIPQCNKWHDTHSHTHTQRKKYSHTKGIWEFTSLFIWLQIIFLMWDLIKSIPTQDINTTEGCDVTLSTWWKAAPVDRVALNILVLDVLLEFLEFLCDVTQECDITKPLPYSSAKHHHALTRNSLQQLKSYLLALILSYMIKIALSKCLVLISAKKYISILFCGHFFVNSKTT